MASAIICFLLLLSEMATYSRVEVVNHMIVDSTTSAGIVPINFRITFPVVPCKGGKTRSYFQNSAAVHLRLSCTACRRATLVLTFFHPCYFNADISLEAESARGENLVHISEQDIEKFPTTGKETSLGGKGQGCTVKGTIRTSKVSSHMCNT